MATTTTKSIAEQLLDTECELSASQARLKYYRDILKSLGKIVPYDPAVETLHTAIGRICGELHDTKEELTKAKANLGRAHSDLEVYRTQ